MILACTGHRPQRIRIGERDAFNRSVMETLVEFARMELERLAPDMVISGMALGWDTAVATACAETGLPFVAAVPFQGQQRKWGKVDQRRYWWLLKQAIEVRQVSEGEYEAWKMQARNEWMVGQLTERDDILLALWDGTSNGGTFHCVQRAKDLGVEVVNVWDRWRSFTGRLGPSTWHQADDLWIGLDPEGNPWRANPI